jgi:hypothetical protein
MGDTQSNMLNLDKVSLKGVIQSLFEDNKFRDLIQTDQRVRSCESRRRTCEYFSVLNALTMNSEVWQLLSIIKSLDKKMHLLPESY